jgi:hypothetical protein
MTSLANDDSPKPNTTLDLAACMYGWVDQGSITDLQSSIELLSSYCGMWFGLLKQ